MSLYLIKGDHVEKQKFSKVKPLEKNQYLIKSKHFVDSTKAIQKQLKLYKEKMLTEGKDTLHIGTVKEFKQKHMELFKKLTTGDSISIQFLDGKKLGERVTVPVEW